LERKGERSGAATWVVALAAATLVSRGFVHPAPAKAVHATTYSAGEDVVAPRPSPPPTPDGAACAAVRARSRAAAGRSPAIAAEYNTLNNITRGTHTRR
jgi:hypothetical protein